MLRDYSRWVFAHNVKEISVVLLRYHFSETESMKSVLVKLLTVRLDALLGHFTTVSVQKVRSRSTR